jgi:acetyl-CoA carboxylase carboxyltransferase component
MTWQDEIDELNNRRRMAQAMGGAEKVARQKSLGRLTVRERIDALADPNSFTEIGTLAANAQYDEAGKLISIMPASFVFGRAAIAGRRVVLCGDDFTVRGGAVDAALGQKFVLAEQMANELRIPIVRLIDGAGGSVKSLEGMGRTYIPSLPAWDWVVDNMAKVPVVALGLGTVAGINAARLVTSHYAIMVEGTSHMFMAGPPVVARLGETVTKDELGGGEIHVRSGAVDDMVSTEDEAFARARRFLSFLPQSVYELPERTDPTDDVNRREEWLIDAIPKDPRKVYDARRVLRAVLDGHSFFEMGVKYGGSVITGLARLDGWPVAVIGSDPYIYAGGWTAAASQKVTRLIDLANTFHLPVVQFTDVPGFVVGVEAEKAGTVRYGARALAALYQAQAPWCTIILRKAFGVAGAANINHTRFRYRYAWPSGDWGSMPFEGGIEAAYRAEIAAAPDPEKAKRDIETRLNLVRSPFRSAEGFLVEEIIDPRDTRPLLCEFANLSAKLRQPGPVATGMRP